MDALGLPGVVLTCGRRALESYFKGNQRNIQKRKQPQIIKSDKENGHFAGMKALGLFIIKMFPKFINVCDFF